jgi:hypothetical protein
MFLETSFEEISLDDRSTESNKSNYEFNKNSTCTIKKLKKDISYKRNDFGKYKNLSLWMKNLKFNLETFDYEALLSQLKPKSSNTPSTKTADRLFFQNQIRINKIYFLKQIQDLQELKNCTFKPKINNNIKIQKHQNHRFQDSHDTADLKINQLPQKSLNEFNHRPKKSFQIFRNSNKTIIPNNVSNI